MPTSVFLEEKNNDFNIVWFKIFKEKLFLLELKEYVEVDLKSNIFTKNDINEGFHISCNVFVVLYQLFDFEIVRKVLNSELKEHSWKHRGKMFKCEMFWN